MCVCVCVCVCVREITQQRNIEKDELPLKEQFVDIALEIC